MALADHYIQFNIGDYLGATQHLKGCDFHGAYLLILFALWRKPQTALAASELPNVAMVETRRWNRTIGPAVVSMLAPCGPQAFVTPLGSAARRGKKFSLCGPLDEGAQAVAGGFTDFTSRLKGEIASQTDALRDPPSGAFWTHGRIAVDKHLMWLKYLKLRQGYDEMKAAEQARLATQPSEIQTAPARRRRTRTRVEEETQQGVSSSTTADVPSDAPPKGAPSVTPSVASAPMIPSVAAPVRAWWSGDERWEEMRQRVGDKLWGYYFANLRRTDDPLTMSAPNPFDASKLGELAELQLERHFREIWPEGRMRFTSRRG